jgi:hypothetical protein
VTPNVSDFALLQSELLHSGDFDKAWPSIRAEKQVSNLKDLERRVSDDALREQSLRDTISGF